MRDRFGDWNSPTAVPEAARFTEARREELLAASSGIAFETVFSTPGKVDFLARSKSRGYFARVFFIGTSDPRINAACDFADYFMREHAKAAGCEAVITLRQKATESRHARPP